jgi:P-type E1-E2 ATPase
MSLARCLFCSFSRLADRWALWFLAATLLLGGGAWWVSGEAIRALAVLVVATPCPLILAAPVALICGVSRAARRGIIVKGGGVLERLARARTALFDKTGTLTVFRRAILTP